MYLATNLVPVSSQLKDKPVSNVSYVILSCEQLKNECLILVLFFGALIKGKLKSINLLRVLCKNNSTIDNSSFSCS